MYETQKANKEINKLIVLLVEHNIPFEARAINIDNEPSIQVCSPAVQSFGCDAVSHKFSYGGTEGLIEIMSLYEDDVIGWLSGEEALKYFIEAYEKESDNG